MSHLRHKPLFLALIAAVKGWACIWLFYLLAQAVRIILRPSNIPISDTLSLLLIYMVATGFVTLLATISLIPLYFLWVSPVRLLQNRWRMYLETALIAMLCTALLTPILKASVNTFLSEFLVLSAFAVGVSLLGSFFFLRSFQKNQSLDS